MSLLYSKRSGARVTCTVTETITDRYNTDTKGINPKEHMELDISIDALDINTNTLTDSLNN